LLISLLSGTKMIALSLPGASPGNPSVTSIGLSLGVLTGLRLKNYLRKKITRQKPD
jgi:hypothetical protein